MCGWFLPSVDGAAGGGGAGQGGSGDGMDISERVKYIGAAPELATDISRRVFFYLFFVPSCAQQQFEYK